MSTHKSLWKCICVVENGTTSSFHILNNAGRLVRPFQKQKLCCDPEKGHCHEENRIDDYGQLNERYDLVH